MNLADDATSTNVSAAGQLFTPLMGSCTPFCRPMLRIHLPDVVSAPTIIPRLIGYQHHGKSNMLFHSPELY